ncbi:MAG: short-chain dehydrogenase [Candidatus Brocadia sp. WS118]|nr:MAG: short-chain dehydrogenase [Candidatus Brocadia sp. WS118]
MREFMRLEKALLFNPPVGMYQRGEDRCQAEVEGSSATSLRPPNDLGYIASMLRQIGVLPFIADYPAEGKQWEQFEKEFKAVQPDFVVMSITTPTIKDDMKAFSLIKRWDSNIFTIAKGAHFSTCNRDDLKEAVYDPMDVAISGEAETIMNNLILAKRQGSDLTRVRGILFRDRRGQIIQTDPESFWTDLDKIPFPARDLMKNSLYTRPDTGEPQATIQTSRGCPSQCIFCLSPLISGANLRERSVSNIVAELEECVYQYNIKNFFFRADTFTLRKSSVIELCQEIIKRKLKIAWVANSRVNTIDEERLMWMKKAGCWLVAFGIESGNDEIQKLIKKGTTRAQAIEAVSICKKIGLKTYGFFLIGFPWETREMIMDTLRLAKELRCTFSEIHIAIPYEGTELYRIVRDFGILKETAVGHNYFSNPAIDTMHVSREELMNLRKKALRSLYLNPGYIAKTLVQIRSFKELKNYTRYGIRLVKNQIKRVTPGTPGWHGADKA